VLLPSAFEAERCQVTYEHGALTVSIPKPEQITPMAIEVQVQELMMRAACWHGASQSP
jgi:HSP20 family molecular chaperone IbpA